MKPLTVAIVAAMLSSSLHTYDAEAGIFGKRCKWKRCRTCTTKVWAPKPIPDQKAPDQTNEPGEPGQVVLNIPPRKLACLRAINAWRAKHGKRALVYSESISGYAQGHAVVMNRMGNVRKKPHGRRTISSAEIITWGQNTPERAVDKWKGSGRHNRAMLANFTEAGIGIQGTDYVVRFR